jgi:hypothetical protein
VTQRRKKEESPKCLSNATSLSFISQPVTSEKAAFVVHRTIDGTY